VGLTHNNEIFRAGLTHNNGIFHAYDYFWNAEQTTFAKNKETNGSATHCITKIQCAFFFYETPKHAWQFHLHPLNSINLYQKL
jgi:hypothetical protein